MPEVHSAAGGTSKTADPTSKSEKANMPCKPWAEAVREHLRIELLPMQEVQYGEGQRGH